VAHPRRREALCAVLEVDGDDDSWPELERPDLAAWDTPEKLAVALSRAGLAGLGGAVFPTGIKLAATWRRRMRLVVVNGVECEPYISCDDMLMRTAPRDVLAGALALVELSGAEQGVVAVEEDKPEALQALERILPMLGTQKLTVLTVPARYPAGGERQLIQMLTGHEVPSLAKPTDIGYLCQNVGTAAALFRFLQSGQPVTSRVTTVTGGAVANPRNLEVRFGTRIADLIALCGGYTTPAARLIKGGSMMGVALDSDLVPVGRATNCILVATEQEIRQDSAAMPCIRCGNCSDACPAYLMPQDLFATAERKEFDALENLGLFDCIECGCCDAVCPSHIRLTDSFRVGKRSFVQTMDHGARGQWLDAREQLRRERVEHWEATHSASAGQEQPHARRLEAVAELIARANQMPETPEIASTTEERNA
jgi:electron transport complex protein RnfC